MKPKVNLSGLAHPLSAVEPKLGYEARLGTAFCVDPECRFVGTNYHVAVQNRPRKIKGVKIIHRYLATRADDEGASLNKTLSGDFLSFNLSRDLAIFELRRPLPNHQGAPFSLEDLELGQQVEIYAFPAYKVELGKLKRRLMHFQGVFKGKTNMGLLAFEYERSDGKAIHGGASGGIVVESRTHKVVGILNAIDRDKVVAYAVPIQSLADLVSRVEPYLAHRLFPTTEYVSPALPDFYPKFVPPRVDALQRRPEESPEVRTLRARAQQLADSIRDFIAVQTFAWGSGNSAPSATAEYEVRVLGGIQQYREYPDGKEELNDHGPLPLSATAISTGSDWADLPKMVGTEWRLKVQQAPDTLVNGRQLKVFQYEADIEDNVCQFLEINDFVFFSRSKMHTFSCYGEVWTDQDTNILRISQNFEMLGRWKNLRSVVTYGWLQRKDEHPRLIPINVSIQAELGKRIYWCRGDFIDYQVFTTKARIVAGNAAP